MATQCEAWAPAQQRITPPVRRAAQRPGNERPELPVSRTRRSVLPAMRSIVRYAAPQSRDPSRRGLAFFARLLTAFAPTKCGGWVPAFAGATTMANEYGPISDFPKLFLTAG